MNGIPNKANEPNRKVSYGSGTTPAPRSATEAMKIVGNGNMGANVPALPRGRRAMPAKMRKGRAK
jgi:hypothetical protein